MRNAAASPCFEVLVFDSIDAVVAVQVLPLLAKLLEILPPVIFCNFVQMSVS